MVFEFTVKYRESDEYKMLCECLRENGVDPLLWDTAIILHKNNPQLYKDKKLHFKQSKEQKTVYNTVEITNDNIHPDIEISEPIINESV